MPAPERITLTEFPLATVPPPMTTAEVVAAVLAIRIAAPALEVIVPPTMPVFTAAFVLLRVPTTCTLPLRSSVPPALTTRACPVWPTPIARVFVPALSFNVPWLTVVVPVMKPTELMERTPAPALVRPAVPLSTLPIFVIFVGVAVGV